MTIRQLALLPLLSLSLLGLALAGCGGDDDSGGDNEELVSALVSEGATEEEARCFVDELGADATQKFITAADAEFSEDELQDVFDALEACGIDTQ